MRQKVKALSIVFCIVLILVSTAGTYAYLTDTESAQNTFTIGKVGISLTETSETNDDSVKVGKENGSGFEYVLIPGSVYAKKPVLTVTEGSAYVRLLVTITNYSGIKKVFGDGFLPQNFAQGWDPSIWPCVNITEDSDTVTYEFRYHSSATEESGPTQNGVLEPLFTHIAAPATLDNGDMESLFGMEIHIVGHAIQTKGFDTEQAAWTAFDAQHGQ